MSSLDLWYTRLDVDELARALDGARDTKQSQALRANVAKARAKDSLKAFAKLTEIVDGEPRIVNDPPVLVPIEELVGPEQAHELEDFMRGVIRSYRRRCRTTGASSSSASGSSTPPARSSASAASARGRGSCCCSAATTTTRCSCSSRRPRPRCSSRSSAKSEYANHGPAGRRGPAPDAGGERHHARLDPHPGLDGVKRDFYVRQLWDAKGSAIIELMDTNAMSAYARLCGGELARAHARSGDAVAIASYLGNSDTFDRALALFAESYADQNERDYEALADAVKSGRVKAESGV